MGFAIRVKNSFKQKWTLMTYLQTRHFLTFLGAADCCNNHLHKVKIFNFLQVSRSSNYRKSMFVKLS